MLINQRREQRHVNRDSYSICWHDDHGQNWSVEVRGMDLSQSGMRVFSARAVSTGIVVFVQAIGGTLAGYCVVRHCTPHGDQFAVGIEFHEETRSTTSVPDAGDVNYYEFLHISPQADLSAIQRGYRMMAARFHPDNPETGDPEKFLILQAAHHTLSDPARRAAYDAHLESLEIGPLPIFELKEFVIGVEGETNRRLGVLSLLYNRRRTSPQNPGVSIFELEKRMGFSREFLDFTTWYLKCKKFVTMEDNSQLTLTALGVDYVESKAGEAPIMERLLHSGTRSATSPPRPTDRSGPAPQLSQAADPIPDCHL